jgi:hypothetical protein
VPDVPTVRRRTALAGAFGSVAATVLAGGCDHGDDLGSPPGTSSPSPKSPSSPLSASSSDAAARTPDEALVDGTIEQLTAAYAVLVSARRFRALRRPLAPLVLARRRHVEVLDGHLAHGVAPTPADPAAALQAVRRSERQLQGALVDAAGRAESGALAKLLASMSASVSQHLATLPPEHTA